jgi:general secretion pathway protein K
MNVPGRCHVRVPGRACSGRRAERGAALLLAMIVLTLVSTLAAGMVWQQSRAIQVEAAERARAQAAWILQGALDWARLILREDARSGGIDSLGEPWATPLAEARLSTFLAADRNNNVDTGPDAFLSGAITDAQSRFNLRDLVDDKGQIVPAELAALQRLCDAAGLASDVAPRLAEGLQAAWDSGADVGAAPLAPDRVADLGWLGLDAASIAQLAPFVSLLPRRTPINANTASREVLLAAIDGLDLGSAERLIQVRQRNPFRNLAEIQRQLPAGLQPDPARVGVGSAFFDVAGRLRMDGMVVEQRSLVQRNGLAVTAIRTERRTLAAASP